MSSWTLTEMLVLAAGREDLGCTMNGVTYQEGQFFQPSCEHHCQCRGGGILCVPACPLVARRPTPDCPHPQFIRLPGKCCREWVCENLENTVIQDAITGEVLGPGGGPSSGVPTRTAAVDLVTIDPVARLLWKTFVDAPKIL